MANHLYQNDLPDGLDLGPFVAIDCETMGLKQLQGGPTSASSRPSSVDLVREDIAERLLYHSPGTNPSARQHVL